MKSFSLNPALAAAIKAARRAGQVMRDHWRRPKRVHAAEAHDVKLELDMRCQRLIDKTLRAAFPEIPLLGEEGDSGDVNSESRWVVDPIDGTVNYFLGIPHAAVSIALQRQTGNTKFQTVLGVIYDPFTDELWTATQDGQTKLNGRAVRVSAQTGKSRKKPAALEPAGAPRPKNPHPGLGGAGTGLCGQRTTGCLHRAHDQFVGHRRRRAHGGTFRR
jgi:fructose-1,6-bisphosphatase/inositol monophosphatase family enzyme